MWAMHLVQHRFIQHPIVVNLEITVDFGGNCLSILSGVGMQDKTLFVMSHRERQT
jgi:hypothetical protein